MSQFDSLIQQHIEAANQAGLVGTAEVIQNLLQVNDKLIEDKKDSDKKLDDAYELLAQLRDNGDFGSQWDEKVTALLVGNDNQK